MFSPEKRLLLFIEKNLCWLVLLLGVFAATWLRYTVRGFYTGDMKVYLAPWLGALRTEGFKGMLQGNFYNYPMAYLCLLFLVAKLPFLDVVAVKILSVAFDYAAAAAIAFLVSLLIPPGSPRRRFWLIGSFVGTLFLPIPFLNSAVWGQCDIIYSFFLLASTAFLLKEKYTPAFCMFALALAFKLQAIFFLPVLIILYCCKKGFSILQFLWAPALLFFMGFLDTSKGSGWLREFKNYFGQTQYEKLLSAGYPNIYAGMQRQLYSMFASMGFVLCGALFFCMLAYLLYTQVQLQADMLLLLIVWCVLTCTCFLPSMHERYGFFAELLIWLYFVAKPSIRRFYLALAVNAMPLLAYQVYLFKEYYISFKLMALLNLLVYLWLSILLVGRAWRQRRLPAGLPKG